MRLFRQAHFLFAKFFRKEVIFTVQFKMRKHAGKKVIKLSCAMDSALQINPIMKEERK